MNVRLVDSLVQTIESLTVEERSLLVQRLNRRQSWEKAKQRLRAIHDQIRQFRQGQPISPAPEELIQQMRDERDQALFGACFPEASAS
jgi:aspartate/methionine/tyrosine aminotransferase